MVQGWFVNRSRNEYLEFPSVSFKDQEADNAILRAFSMNSGGFEDFSKHVATCEKLPCIFWAKGKEHLHYDNPKHFFFTQTTFVLNTFITKTKMRRSKLALDYTIPLFRTFIQKYSSPFSFSRTVSLHSSCPRL